MLILDVFLIFAVILGIKLDNNARRKIDHGRASKIMMDDDKVYNGVEDDSKVIFNNDNDKPFDAEGTTPATGNVNVVSGNAHQLDSGSPHQTYCLTFKIYHRCVNIYTSNYHLLNRPFRAFSLAL